MLPRWFRAVIVLEVAGAAVLGVLLVRLATSGVEAVGQVVDWARPQVEQGGAGMVAPVVPGTPAPVTGAQLGQLGMLGGPFFSRLDHDTATTATGELHLITELEDLIRERITRAIDGAAAKGR